LIERLERGAEHVRVIDFAAGSGRNGEALRNAGFDVTTIDDQTAMAGSPLDSIEGSFDALISTHGFLHGTVAEITKRLELIARRLKPRGLLFATFGSTRDARFGEGRRIDVSTYAPLHGDERGVAHCFFTRSQLERVLDSRYDVESLAERRVDAVAGRWAHPGTPLRKAVHWFLEAHTR
jgi:hypothetical protein